MYFVFEIRAVSSSRLRGEKEKTAEKQTIFPFLILSLVRIRRSRSYFLI